MKYNSADRFGVLVTEERLQCV